MWPRCVLYCVLDGDGVSRGELRRISAYKFRLRRCITRCVAMRKGTGGINESTLEA